MGDIMTARRWGVQERLFSLPLSDLEKSAA